MPFKSFRLQLRSCDGYKGPILPDVVSDIEIMQILGWPRHPTLTPQTPEAFAYV